MRTLAEFWNAEAYRTLGIGAEIILEIIVQCVSASQFTVDNQLQVVTDAVTSGIDAAGVGNLGKELGRRVDGTTIHKGTAVQITEHGGTFVVAAFAARASEQYLVGIAVGFYILCLVDGIDVDESGSAGIADITGHDKREGEFALTDIVAALEKRFVAIGIGECCLSLGRIV